MITPPGNAHAETRALNTTNTPTEAVLRNELAWAWYERDQLMLIVKKLQKDD